MKNRVVITGIGVISPIGSGKDFFWGSLIKGEDGIKEIESFDTSEYRTHRGGEIKDDDWRKYVKKDDIDRLGPVSALALAVTRLAIRDGGIKLSDLGRRECSVCFGTTAGKIKIVRQVVSEELKNKYKSVSPDLVKNMSGHLISGDVLRELGIRADSLVFSTTCAAGNYALGYGYDLISFGKADMVIAGGVDVLFEEAFAGFNRLFAVAPLKCQPFSRNRKGMILSEGAGVVILESEEKAKKRRARIYGEILGYGFSCDAYHPTNPHPAGEGIINVFQDLFKNSSISPENVDYINAHGTGTKANDRAEAQAIKAVFKDKTQRLPVSSIKSMLGHSMGASSAIEAVACCLTIQNSIIPPTINYEEKDTECDIDCVPNRARNQKVKLALSNSFGFGGNNSVIAIGKYYG